MDEATNQGGGSPGDSADTPPSEQVHNVGKLLRVGGMLREMLDESRRGELDQEGRRQARDMLGVCVVELKGAISPDLQGELDRVNGPFGSEVPSQSELRLRQAQLVGWFEGLFHGMQATLMGQMGQQVPHPMRRPGQPGGPGPESRPGQYL